MRSSSLASRRKGNRGESTSEHQRQLFVCSRLAALENDEHPADENSDDDFHIADEFQDEDEVADEQVDVGVNAALQKQRKGKKKKKKGGGKIFTGKRKTRGMERRGPKPFLQLLEEADLDRLPAHVPTYFNTAARPSRYPPRKLCDISGFLSKYKDPASKMRYVGQKEYNVIQSMPTAALHVNL
jgi:hypothetical protein